MQPAGDSLRHLSEAELVRLGEESLREHVAAQAVVAHHQHAPLTLARLEAFLNDPQCVRYPTRLVFEFGEMAGHQFAEPGPDLRDPQGHGRVLYLRPVLRDRPDLALLAVAYMIPAINYGEIITDEHCVRYGATLLGMMESEFYDAVCRMADFAGAAPRPEVGCGDA
jgi:hypothetical protein